MSTSLSRLRAARALLFLFVLTAAAPAAENGGLAGTVIDETGSVVPGATVTVTDGSGAARTTTTSVTGSFRFPDLAPGKYTVTASLSGFQQAAQQVEVEDGRLVQLQITMPTLHADEPVVFPDFVDAVREPVGVDRGAESGAGAPDAGDPPPEPIEPPRPTTSGGPPAPTGDPPDTTRDGEPRAGGAERGGGAPDPGDPPREHIELPRPIPSVPSGSDAIRPRPVPPDDPIRDRPTAPWAELRERLGLEGLPGGFFAVGPDGPAGIPVAGGPPSDAYQRVIADFFDASFFVQELSAPRGARRDAGAAGSRWARAAGSLAEVIASWFRRPGVPVAAVATPDPRHLAFWPAGPPVGAGRRTAQGTSTNRPRISIVATGTSSGEAFEVRFLNSSGEPMQVLAPDGLVLEPVADDDDGAMATGGSSGAASMTGFCLEYGKPSAPAGARYQVAPGDVQARYRPLTAILQAGRALAEAGRFNPDSDPAAYATSIRQWALWTRLEGWDEEAFTQALVDRTRQNVENAGRAWTPEMEAALRDAAPNRYRDVQAVLREAEARGERAGR